MRNLLSIAILFSVAMPALAAPQFNVPEPGTLTLLAVAAVGLLAARRKK